MATNAHSVHFVDMSMDKYPWTENSFQLIYLHTVLVVFLQVRGPLQLVGHVLSTYP